jgi:DNA repair exonuclease SbcCD ATPase subunit
MQLSSLPARDSTPNVTCQDTTDWEATLSEYLEQLSQVQGELLTLLEEKRRCMVAGDFESIGSFQNREQEIAQRLEQLQARRQQMLEAARQMGLQVENLEKLAELTEQGKSAKLQKQVQQVASRLRLTQHAALTHWIVAQRSLLHVMQMLEILATGGRLLPTYGPERTAPWRGGLVDQEA